MAELALKTLETPSTSSAGGGSEGIECVSRGSGIAPTPLPGRTDPHPDRRPRLDARPARRRRGRRPAGAHRPRGEPRPAHHHHRGRRRVDRRGAARLDRAAVPRHRVRAAVRASASPRRSRSSDAPLRRFEQAAQQEARPERARRLAERKLAEDRVTEARKVAVKKSPGGVEERRYLDAVARLETIEVPPAAPVACRRRHPRGCRRPARRAPLHRHHLRRAGPVRGARGPLQQRHAEHRMVPGGHVRRAHQGRPDEPRRSRRRRPGPVHGLVHPARPARRAGQRQGVPGLRPPGPTALRAPHIRCRQPRADHSGPRSPSDVVGPAHHRARHRGPQAPRQPRTSCASTMTADGLLRSCAPRSSHTYTRTTATTPASRTG